jgi:hypothetical protein
MFVPLAVGSRLELRIDNNDFSATVAVRHCTEMPSDWLVGLQIIEKRGNG